MALCWFSRIYASTRHQDRYRKTGTADYFEDLLQVFDYFAFSQREIYTWKKYHFGEG